jgi:hypothetical protein
MGRLYSLAGSMMFGLSAIGLVACNGTSVIGGGEGGDGAGAASGENAYSCSWVDALATPAELAATPRANAEAEWLALEVTGAFTAPSDVYDRVLQDLSSIRAMYPEVASLHTRNLYSLGGGGPGLKMDDDGFAAAMAQTYTDWDCLNALVGTESVDLEYYEFIDWNSARINFDYSGGRFNMPRIMEEYTKLPHILQVENSWNYGDGNDVCASRQNTTYSYVFDIGTGDCPLGCTEHTYFGFSTTPDGSITSLGTFSTGFIHGIPDPPPPAWFSSLEACTKELVY